MGGDQIIERGLKRKFPALAGAAVFEFDRAGGDPAGADDELFGQPDQIHRREFGAGGFVAIVVERLDAGAKQFGIKVIRGGAAPGIGRTQIDQPDAERRDAVRPDDAGVVVVGLDQRADEARHADPVGAHFQRGRRAVGTGRHRPHRPRILVAKVKDVADLDAACGHQLLRRDRARGMVVLFVCRGVKAGPAPEHRLEIAAVIDLGGEDVGRQPGAVAIDRRFAGFGQDDEFVAEVATDRPGIGLHRDRLETHPGEGPQISYKHLVVGPFGADRVEVEAVGVLHQEFAATHHAKAWPHLVPEFPLDVVKEFGQIAVALYRGANNLGDLLLVGRAVQHLTVVPVADAQHFLAVIVVAAALAPQLCRLDRRHQDLQRAGAVLLLAHDLLDLRQDTQPERQPGIDPGARLADHPGAQHQPMRDDLRLARVLSQQRQEVFGKTHQLTPATRAHSM